MSLPGPRATTAHDNARPEARAASLSRWPLAALACLVLGPGGALGASSEQVPATTAQNTTAAQNTPTAATQNAPTAAPQTTSAQNTQAPPAPSAPSGSPSAAPTPTSGNAEQLGTALPWRGAFLQFRERDNRGVGKYTQDIGHLTLSFQVDAPLDQETRRAAFEGLPGARPAFGAVVTLEWSHMRADLEEMLAHLPAPDALCLAYARVHPGKACAGDAYEAWVKEELGRRMDARVRARSPGTVVTPKARPWSIGVELTARYDRLSAYGEDLEAEPSPVTASEISAMALGRLFPSDPLAVTVRGGVAAIDTARALPATRCQELVSTEPGVTGEACQDVAALTDDPEPKWSGQVDLTLTYVPTLKRGAVVPGLEVTAGAIGLGQARVWRGGFTAFITPVTEPLRGRFGAGLEVLGTEAVTPFLLVGGGL